MNPFVKYVLLFSNIGDELDVMNKAWEKSTPWLTNNIDE